MHLLVVTEKVQAQGTELEGLSLSTRAEHWDAETWDRQILSLMESLKRTEIEQKHELEILNLCVWSHYGVLIFVSGPCQPFLSRKSHFSLYCL